MLQKKNLHYFLTVLFLSPCFFSCAPKKPLITNNGDHTITQALTPDKKSKINDAKLANSNRLNNKKRQSRSHELKAIVTAAHPKAAKVGYDILEAGGSSVDAAIAAQMVLNIVEPQSSGIGGGGFLLYFSPTTKKVTTYDGRETAPSSAKSTMFLNSDGSRKNFYEAAVSGISVGVPGLLKMLELAHTEHGILPWEVLFAPAIRLAKNGFEVSKRLQNSVKRDNYLGLIPETAAYFLPGDKPISEGQILKNPEFAEVLEEIAKDGAKAFYLGKTAAAISDTVRKAPTTPGKIMMTDLSEYIAKERDPICTKYRSWTVCGMPPPTSGGITIAQILGILENFDLKNKTPFSSEAIHLITEASRLAFADRSTYLADPDFIDIPVKELLAKNYLLKRASYISENIIMKSVTPGKLGKENAYRFSPSKSGGGLSTTHLSIIDRHGNVVSMTSSIEGRFGSHLTSRGFLLNNQLTDFSFVPSRGGVPIANSVKALKRPRSSMSPSLVFGPDGNFLLAIGSPGGSRIISYVVKTLVAALDWGIPLQQAINAPNFANVSGVTDIEKGTRLEAMVPELKRLGHKIKIRSLTSGLHGIMRTSSGLVGGADKRREGVVIE